MGRGLDLKAGITLGKVLLVHPALEALHPCAWSRGMREDPDPRRS